MSNTNNTKSKDTSTVQTPKLAEKVIKVSLENFNWHLLRKHLNEIGFNKDALDLLLGHLRREDSFIIRYPNEELEKKREKFYKAFVSYIRDTLGEGGAVLVFNEIELLAKIEQGYRSILELLERCEISKLESNVRCAAHINISLHKYENIIKESLKTIKSRGVIFLPHGPLLENETMMPVSPDQAIYELVQSLKNTLMMEACKNKWFDNDKFVVLPTLPTIGDDERFKAGSTEYLSQLWLCWERTEQRRRFLGGTFEEFNSPNFPVEVPKVVQRLTIYTPTDEEFYHYAADRRLYEQIGQALTELCHETNIGEKATGICNDVSLYPTAYVSVEEVNAALHLSRILGYNISDDNEPHSGLRFVEWLRGYAVLKQIAEDRNKTKNSISELNFSISSEKLIDLMERCGLSHEAAVRFINAVTLNKSSRDMFECPLIKMTGGGLMVFAPALIGSALAYGILSNISKNDPLQRKGKAFENDILSFLKAKKLRVKTFKVKRDGEQYEYDIVLDWGKYVFIFECKNHSLSNNPVKEYYFDLGIRSDVKQVIRLARALQRYPDILFEQFGADVTMKTIVPCILNSMPYSQSGQIDGVYVTDASVLKRFFQKRYFNIKKPVQINKNDRMIFQSPIYSFWESDQPSPEDLLKQLEKPFQLELIRKKTQIARQLCPLGPTEIFVPSEFIYKQK